MKIPSVLTGFLQISLVFSKGNYENVASLYLFFVCGSRIFMKLYGFCRVFFIKMISVYMAFLEFLEILWKIKSFQRDLVKTLIFPWCISSYYKVCMKTIHVLTWLYINMYSCVYKVYMEITTGFSWFLSKPKLDKNGFSWNLQVFHMVLIQTTSGLSGSYENTQYFIGYFTKLFIYYQGFFKTTTLYMCFHKKTLVLCSFHKKVVFTHDF